MAARGVKTKVEGTDGSDFSYRQTIEDRYILMAETKTNIRTFSYINTGYFGISIILFVAQLIIPSLNELLSRISSFYQLPSLLMLLYTIIAFGITYITAKRPTVVLLLGILSLFTLAHLVITILYPLFVYFTKSPTSRDNMIPSIFITTFHAIGYVTMMLLLIQCFTLRRLQSVTKRK
jgi:hypothetical protein